MKFGALTIFKRQVDNHGRRASSVIVAAWHWKWSLTWSFILTYDHRNKHLKKYRSRIAAWRVYRDQGFYFHAGIRLPGMGMLFLQTQPTMRK